MFRLYLITDRRLVPDLPAAIDRALAALPRGAAAIQLREKDLSTRALFDLAIEVGAVCRRHGAPLLVNDRIDVALAAGADGVHLGERSVEVKDARSLGCRLVGASCHDAASLERRSEADFVLMSPIFPTPGKGPAVGLEALRAASRAHPSVFALGGVDPGNAGACTAAGAQGVAAIRAWLATDDPGAACASLLQALAPPPFHRAADGER